MFLVKDVNRDVPELAILLWFPLNPLTIPLIICGIALTIFEIIDGKFLIKATNKVNPAFTSCGVN